MTCSVSLDSQEIDHLCLILQLDAETLAEMKRQGETDDSIDEEVQATKALIKRLRKAQVDSKLKKPDKGE